MGEPTRLTSHLRLRHPSDEPRTASSVTVRAILISQLHVGLSAKSRDSPRHAHMGAYSRLLSTT
ncbi:hypothetical protein BU26DRAFT_137985 [Trematosphaeria pertusa]|uniref:Uncharacterized protein n=1 Tax=Trematosphaeria pertusa TaxID=390896 RepID=A0A6A6IVN4_9PLEO|nr:uncharacterized protein BU26DRAFT_137985 [Trematosphaeria pertusa]KAF2254436.1 hypothetical protein BU26DRAFT_137985 [Trematosphaeria pertusa]